MSMHFEELNAVTREYMLREFRAEGISGKPYLPKVLTPAGLSVFPTLVEQALSEGDEDSLVAALKELGYWRSHESYVRDGIVRERCVNVEQAAERLGLTEFNTWYVRGLSARLMEEGADRCQVYRAGTPKWSAGECSRHEGAIYAIETIYHGHRLQYWPEPGARDAFSVPAGPNCHHTIRRLR